MKAPKLKSEKHLRALRGALTSLYVQLPSTDSGEKHKVGRMITDLSEVIEAIETAGPDLIVTLNNRL